MDDSIDQPTPIRIGDRERNSAMEALGEHVGAGRLDLAEFDERSTKVTAARTADHLTALFTDLPAPHPVIAGLPMVHVARGLIGPAPDTAVIDRSWDHRSAPQRAAAALVPLIGIIALVLFFAAGLGWWVFLLPAAVAVIGGALWGDHWKDHPTGLSGRQPSTRPALRDGQRSRRDQVRRPPGRELGSGH